MHCYITASHTLLPSPTQARPSVSLFDSLVRDCNRPATKNKRKRLQQADVMFEVTVMVRDGYTVIKLQQTSNDDGLGAPQKHARPRVWRWA
jgi:hypothetical protein